MPGYELAFSFLPMPPMTRKYAKEKMMSTGLNASIPPTNTTAKTINSQNPVLCATALLFMRDGIKSKETLLRGLLAQYGKLASN